jgi:hypothetical protein
MQSKFVQQHRIFILYFVPSSLLVPKNNKQKNKTNLTKECCYILRQKQGDGSFIMTIFPWLDWQIM